MSATESLDGAMNGPDASQVTAGNGRALGEAVVKPALHRKSVHVGPRGLSVLGAINDRLIDYYGIAALLILWEAAPRLGWIESQFFPPLSSITAEGLKLAKDGTLFQHVAVSLMRTFLGLVCAVALALPLGFVLGGWFPRFTRFLSPLLKLLGQINAFSLFPLFVLFFGIGEMAKFSIIFWSCLWPVLFTTIAGVQEVDPLFVKLARSMGSGRMILLVKVLLPGSLPSIFTGVRIGATVAFLMLIAAEMIGAGSGLGWLVLNSSVNYIIPRLYLAALLIALLGMVLNASLHRLEARLIRWKVA
jgi:NitT/TauT family transport system permease protein